MWVLISDWALYCEIPFIFNDHEIGIDLDQVASDVLNVSLDFLIDHDSFCDRVLGQSIDMFFMGHDLQLIHELLVEDFVEVRFEECDDAVDVGVLFF